MHKLAKPPITTPDKSYNSLQISPNVFKGGSPVLNWNLIYNKGEILRLKSSSVLQKQYINYYKQPFNFIEIDSIVPSSGILVINNVPPCWWSICNCGIHNIIISPQINGSENYDSTNEYILTPGEYKIMSIQPGNPPLIDLLKNPTSLKLN